MKIQKVLDSASIYDLEQAGNREDIAFFCGAAQKIGGPVLDLGCGTGRLTIPVAETGNELVGVDISMTMLGRFREKLKTRPQEIRKRIGIIRANIARFSLKKKFRMAICSSNTLFLLESRAAVARALNCVQKHLLPGGRFIIDVDAISEETRAALVKYPLEDVDDIIIPIEPGKNSLRRTHSIRPLGSTRGGRNPNFSTNRFSVSYKYHDEWDHVCATRQENVILLTPDELFQLLHEQGFVIAGKFGGYDRRPFTGTEHKLIIVTRKERE